MLYAKYRLWWIDCEDSSDGEYSNMRYLSESEDELAIDWSINEIVIQDI